MGILIRVDGIPAQRRILPMLAVRITGNQLRAGRALADLSMEDLAARANRDASRAANGAESPICEGLTMVRSLARYCRQYSAASLCRLPRCSAAT